MNILLNEQQLKRVIESRLNEEVFNYDDLTPEQQQKAYELFKDSYEKAVGSSWSQEKFHSRASGWTFYGLPDKGFVVLRKQHSGMNKLTGVAGDIRAIGVGMADLMKVDEPIWGMADKRIVDTLVKKFGFISPNAFVLKMMMKMIPSSVWGGTEYVVNDDGSVTFKYEDVGDATKFFFGNKQYFTSVAPTVASKLSGVPGIMKKAVMKFFS